MKRVLITGGHGIVGRHAVAALLKQNLEIHALGRSVGHPEILPASVHWHRCDLLREDPSPLLERIKPEGLLHLAWNTEHGKFWTAPDNMDWVAVSLTLLQAFGTIGGKRFVAAGSCAEYDWHNLGDGICNASTPLHSPFLYGVAKDTFRQLAEAYCAAQKISFAWGRIFLLYGEGEPPQRLVPSVIRALENGETAKVSHCEQVRDFMSTRDCGRAFAALLTSNVEGALNIASGETVTLKNVVETIRSLVGKGDVQYGAIAAAAHDPKRLVADITRLREEVRFSPEDKLAAGLARMIHPPLAA